MLTAFCGPVVHCDNHSLASFKDGANPPTAPSAACFVPSAESSHLVPASRCQLLPGQLLSQVSNRAHPGRVRSTVELRWSCQMLMSTIEVINHMKPRGVALSLCCIYFWLENMSSVWASAGNTSWGMWINNTCPHSPVAVGSELEPGVHGLRGERGLSFFVRNVNGNVSFNTPQWQQI